MLEKTQTEAFLEFAAQYPGVRIKQRKFEILKPFFVRAASERDRRSCLCRKHVEAQVILKDCMKFRKETLKKTKEMCKLHEFTDGCAAQYKSRYCIGDLSSCFADFGFQINRNYFETLHAKGEQDAAGSNVKQKVSHAVLRKAAIVRNAKDMVNYLNENFKYPAVTTYDSRKKAVGLARRVFFYVPAKGEGAVVRKRPDRHFKEIKGIRKLHCVRTTKQQGRVFVRERTCYCFACIKGDEKSCSNKGWLDEWHCIYIERESFAATTRRTAEETEAVRGDTAVRIRFYLI